MLFLIIQTGDPVPKAKAVGSFADWFMAGMGLATNQVQVVDVHKGEELPAFDSEDWTAVLVTGSASMVTEQLDWMKQTQRWLTEAFAAELPTLGVCFGHQLIADLLGGQVDYNPLGRHMGLSALTLNDAGRQDKLLGKLSPNNVFNTFVSHQQNVLQLPQCVTLLGSCENDSNHVFRYKDHVWGVQFHPEWDQSIMRTYIEAREKALLEEGFDPASMAAQLTDCDEAESLLKHFAAFSQQRKSA
ncbi:glutamine amidotransferase [Marinicella litoralis]|uniref:GMP synthase (Glutamine-hydrolysing) n=1 Tax=Marinicella litoralis TaxID=644220 RepID=A0A4R6XUF3_9GAMM|nr:glutamine amidotransferase [Marinicella litoralis]TDR23635.1 GMP synthase (glutamine-hydrolysing) [Marinicella litoralis]